DQATIPELSRPLTVELNDRHGAVEVADEAGQQIPLAVEEPIGVRPTGSDPGAKIERPLEPPLKRGGRRRSFGGTQNPERECPMWIVNRPGERTLGVGHLAELGPLERRRSHECLFEHPRVSPHHGPADIAGKLDPGRSHGDAITFTGTLCEWK